MFQDGAFGKPNHSLPTTTSQQPNQTTNTRPYRPNQPNNNQTTQATTKRTPTMPHCTPPAMTRGRGAQARRRSQPKRLHQQGTVARACAGHGPAAPPAQAWRGQSCSGMARDGLTARHLPSHLCGLRGRAVAQPPGRAAPRGHAHKPNKQTNQHTNSHQQTQDERTAPSDSDQPHKRQVPTTTNTHMHQHAQHIRVAHSRLRSDTP